MNHGTEALEIPASKVAKEMIMTIPRISDNCLICMLVQEWQYSQGVVVAIDVALLLCFVTVWKRPFCYNF